MASPAKQPRTESETVVGYLHSVSPLKNSKKNVRYFNATLQSGREEYRRVVVFAVDKRPAFTQASVAKRAVKLTNVRKTVSYCDPAGFDVMFANTSGLEVMENLPFFWREPSNIARVRIADVLALGPRQQVGVVHAKILPDGAVSRVVPVAGVPRELKEVRICDRSGLTTLTLWEGQILSVEASRSYRLCNLVTRKVGDRTVLTSTRTTTVTEIADVGEPESLEPHDDSRETTTLRGCVSGVQISQKQRCRRCHANQDNFSKRSSTHQCQGCKMLQRASSFILSYSGTLLLSSEGEEHSVSFTNSSVYAYLAEHLGGSVSDAEAIEEHLIGAGETEVRVNGSGLILSVVHLADEVGVKREDAEGAPEASAGLSDASTDASQGPAGQTAAAENPQGLPEHNLSADDQLGLELLFAENA
ncbi:hypothetical protein MATL_G00136760 [Megalops atlanticus]|uniref:Uncharacterized protein n=1 Tax=Megalops atlanticus TaxID=7932 RepID=A0A9D3PV46_MEGAT|nr:hypothetical protein MATL_G00136760 [Megalops atlanticus]